ncbi:MAPEG family protein [Shewanella avicenniae]|uniref:MAPEG family protein n=1 Tax=Shewanella avicenniae TaxID=2814294 RepID=A0ABX7QRS0_9GAMM|nr:MAPEG family protein [Shewanella avicenniae]QSX33398.1 MAPEG family protein [Shewanella avicenniae]
MTLYVSGLYAALSGLLLLGLSALVVLVRVKKNVGIGDGQQPSLIAAIRAQGNYVEYAPMVLLLLALAEVAKFEPMWLHILGIVWLVGRLLHAYGMVKAEGGVHLGRLVGILSTWAVLLLLSGINLYLWALN